MARDTGGSVGIAAVTTLLARGAQVHQAAMSSHISPYEPAVQERLRQMGGTMHGADTTQQLYAALYATLVQQATVLSYIDIFRWLSFLCLLCVPATLLFERVKKRAGAVAIH